ncbi:MAG: indolepyruvate ferredoxin oxidoreductase subunit alpha [Ruminococcaceae bacterium]|nr:indolepyruvate ferredoxin oxidoreductase subunit alpha [Oscillospiraceae bacterium]
MKELLLGNAAIARGAYEAGAKVFSSYPGTPSTEITENAAKYDEIYTEWAPNEKVALEVAIGASIAGARSCACMKHVGLNVAADPLFTVGYTGVNGGLVICVADDPGMHSSQNEQDSRHYAEAAKVLMLEPSDSAECKTFMKEAFSLSEQFDSPVLLRLSTRIAHSQSLVELSDRVEVENKPYTKDVMKYVMMPAMARGRHVAVEERLQNAASFAETTKLNKIEYNDKKIGIITAGTGYFYAKEALPNASFLKLGMVFPLPEKLIRDFAANVEKLYVIEELDPFIENHVRRLGIAVEGKSVMPIKGEITAALIREKILGTEKVETVKANEPVPVRPPVLCPGCPHRGMHYVLKKLGLRVTGDIGCYTLGALAPLESIDTCVCMGAGIGMAHGMEMAAGRDPKTVAIIGDSTFMHSGITGLINVVYNKGTSTTIILDNSITGMTGHQQNPTTGFTLKGEPTKQVDLEALCRAIGIDRVVIADPFDVDAFEKVVKEEVMAEEPSVIIAQRPCALLKSVKYTGKVSVDAEKCKNCKMCMKIGCPAISYRNGIVIDPTLCNGCGLCMNVCKFGALVKEEAR